MGRDMLENSELSALAPSRLGNKRFINSVPDGGFSNFSIVNTKKEDAKALVAIDSNWKIDPSKAADCDYLQLQFTKIKNEREGFLAQNPSEAMWKRWGQPLLGYETKIKNAIATQQCVEVKQQAERALEQQNTLDVLATVAATPPPMIPEDTTAISSSKTNKYLMYGVGAAILVIAVIILRKK